MKKSRSIHTHSFSRQQIWAAVIARLDGVGRCETWGRVFKRGQGTVASLIAIPFWWALNSYELHWLIYISLVIAINALGVWAIRIYEKQVGGADLPEVVIDEFVGMGISMFLLPSGWQSVVLAFILFRIFDISKPMGVKFFDDRHLKGWGVMLDDVVAGLYSLAILQLLRFKGWI